MHRSQRSLSQGFELFFLPAWQYFAEAVRQLSLSLSLRMRSFHQWSLREAMSGQAGNAFSECLLSPACPGSMAIQRLKVSFRRRVVFRTMEPGVTCQESVTPKSESQRSFRSASQIATDCLQDAAPRSLCTAPEHRKRQRVRKVSDPQRGGRVRAVSSNQQVPVDRAALLRGILPGCGRVSPTLAN